MCSSVRLLASFGNDVVESIKAEGFMFVQTKKNKEPSSSG